MTTDHRLSYRGQPANQQRAPPDLIIQDAAHHLVAVNAVLLELEKIARLPVNSALGLDPSNARVDPGRDGQECLRAEQRTPVVSWTLLSWTILFTKQAQKDAGKLASVPPALKQKAQAVLDLLAVAPYRQPPTYADLVGELPGRAHGASTSSTASFIRC